MTQLQFPLTVTKMHPIALTIAPHLAMRTLVGFHPFPVAVDLELVLPYLPKTILVNVTLMVVTADAETS